MNNDTLRYLADYIEQLDRIDTPAQVYEDLSDWHFENKARLVAATIDINAALGLAGRFKLQPHMATTAIGRLDGDMVVISANPGFSPKPIARAPGRMSANALEDAYRSDSKAQNSAFCADFFSQYPPVCYSYSPYWRMVMRLQEMYAGQNPADTTPALWQNMAANPVVGGIDLLPFHSTGDGITCFLFGRNAQPLLREVAMATLAMAVRLAPRFLLVTSPAGQKLLQQLMDTPEMAKRLPRRVVLAKDPQAAAPYDRITAWHAVTLAGSTIIVSFPYQIFSGTMRAHQIHYQPAEFVKHLQAFLAQSQAIGN